MSFERILKRGILALAVGMSLYHLAVAYLGTPEAFFFRGTHLLFALVLTFLINPPSGGAAQKCRGSSTICWCCCR